MPDTVNAAVGSVTVYDEALLDQLKANPTDFYGNLHTAEFPGGAVRGQLHRSSRAIDLNAVLRGGPLAAQADGFQEVPGPAPVGDPDGHASAYLRADRDKVNYSFSWSGIRAPTEGHVHEGGGQLSNVVALHRLNTVGGIAPAGTCDPKTQPFARSPYQADYLFITKEHQPYHRWPPQAGAATGIGGSGTATAVSGAARFDGPDGTTWNAIAIGSPDEGRTAWQKRGSPDGGGIARGHAAQSRSRCWRA